MRSVVRACILHLSAIASVAIKLQGHGTSPPSSPGDETMELVRAGRNRDHVTLGLPVFRPPDEGDLSKMSPLEARPLPDAAAEIEDPGRKERRAPSALGCEHLDRPVEDQFDKVMTLRSRTDRPVAWTVIDKSYAAYAVDQQAQMEESADLPFLIFVAIDLDRSVARGICMQGLAVVDYAVEFVNQTTPGGFDLEWTTKYRVAKAKFSMPRIMRQRQVASLFTESDVFWLRDPMPQYNSAVTSFSQAPRASVVLGTHHNNPNSINIGTWYVPSDAAADLDCIFQLAWDIMIEFYNPDMKDKAFTIFDQNVLDDVLMWAGQPNRDRCAFLDKSKPYCNNIAQAKCGSVVTSKLSPNVIQSCVSHAISNDDETAAVHVLLGKPLEGAQGKMLSAKLADVFIGRPGYYEREREPTGVRYLAWDGDMQQATTEHQYCKFPLYGESPEGCGFTKALPLLAVLGARLGRAVVLPKINDLNGRLWPAEAVFDSRSFTSQFKVTVRESTFLYSRHLNAKNMYPVARLRVSTKRWAAIQFIATQGATPENHYFSLPDGTQVTNALSSLLDHPKAKSAKTVLVMFYTMYGLQNSNFRISSGSHIDLPNVTRYTCWVKEKEDPAARERLLCSGK